MFWFVRSAETGHVHGDGAAKLTDIGYESRPVSRGSWIAMHEDDSLRRFREA
jgi:hypothetical protein